MKQSSRNEVESLVKKYLIYLIRWQLSTPILAIFTGGFSWESIKQSALANLVGGLIFFWVDRWIFSRERKRKPK
jgi:hypothetical protein